MTISLSIIIPTNGAAPFLPETLASITRFADRPEFIECIVVENGTKSGMTDRVVADAKERVPEAQGEKIRYIYEEVGSSLAGRHRGFFESQGNLLAFIDDDVILRDGWIDGVVEIFSQQGIDVAGGPSSPRYLSDPPKWVSSLVQTLADGGTSSPFLSLLDLPGGHIREISPLYIWSLNLLIRREVFERAGGLHPCVVPREELMFAGDGETGLARSLISLGAKAVYCPRLAVEHVIPAGRLTWSFIDNRSQVEGVALAFTALRKRGNSTFSRWFSRELLGQFRHFLSQPSFWTAGEEGRVHRRILRGTVKGWSFLFRHFARDPQVREWVLRPTFWDYEPLH